MITAHAQAYAHHVHVVFQYPGNQKKEINLPGADMDRVAGQVKRLMYFHNRKYVISKLRGWLKQRLYAFDHTQRAAMSQDAARLIVLLGYYEKASFFRLCDLVADNRAAIERLAPAPASSHYAHYQGSIVPVLDFCRQMKEGVI